MIERIFPDLYKIAIPLPRNPLKFTNSYFIRGQERSLLIDTGFNRSECRDAMRQAIAELDISLADTDLFITHLHSDHSGLVKDLFLPGMKVFGGEYFLLTSARGNAGPQWSYFEEFITESGLKNVAQIVVEDHPGYKFASEPFGEIEVIKDGDVITVGDYNFRCLETGGHCPDHFCLYEPAKKLLISGDHILGNITPNITLWNTPGANKRDYLGEYLANLDKCASLEVDLVLPGHRDVIRDHRARIAQLKKHHQERLLNVLAILGDAKMSGAEVSAQMEWSLTFKNWYDFPPAQKIFATGEALAHLEHLVFTGKAAKSLQTDIVYYEKT
jgi:glyoxylase-like metal-dependent hydrolase (beta-lactamase superfamily II)